MKKCFHEIYQGGNQVSLFNSSKYFSFVFDILRKHIA
jgi:hypothetical protein